MGKPPYCKPLNAGLASTPQAVARKLGKLFDALDSVSAWIACGPIGPDLQEFRHDLLCKLEAAGWTVSAMNGSLQGTNRMHVYPPGSPTGEKIRKWRES